MKITMKLIKPYKKTQKGFFVRETFNFGQVDYRGNLTKKESKQEYQRAAKVLTKYIRENPQYMTPQLVQALNKQTNYLKSHKWQKYNRNIAFKHLEQTVNLLDKVIKTSSKNQGYNMNIQKWGELAGGKRQISFSLVNKKTKKQMIKSGATPKSNISFGNSSVMSSMSASDIAASMQQLESSNETYDEYKQRFMEKMHEHAEQFNYGISTKLYEDRLMRMVEGIRRFDSEFYLFLEQMDDMYIHDHMDEFYHGVWSDDKIEQVVIQEFLKTKAK